MQLSSGARYQAHCLKLPLVVRAISEGSGQTVQMSRLAWAFAVCLCDKYLFLMNGLIYGLLKLVGSLFNFLRSLMGVFLAYKGNLEGPVTV